MSKTHYELRLNKHTMKISRRRWDNFIQGSFRICLSFILIGCAAAIGKISSNIVRGVYPMSFGDEVTTLGDGVFGLVLICVCTPVLFWMLIGMCDWGEKKEVKK